MDGIDSIQHTTLEEWDTVKPILLTIYEGKPEVKNRDTVRPSQTGNVCI